jgi:hypothetical protein
MPPLTFVAASCSSPTKAEGMHDAGHGPQQPEQRRESNEGAENPKALFRVLNLVHGPQLHRAQQRTMRVREALIHGREKRIARVGAQFSSMCEPALRNCHERFIEHIAMAAAAELPPPQPTLKDDHQRGEQAKEDWPHNRAAFDEQIHNHISKHRGHKQSRVSSNFNLRYLPHPIARQDGPYRSRLPAGATRQDRAPLRLPG